MNSPRLRGILLLGLMLAILSLMWPIAAFGDDRLFETRPASPDQPAPLSPDARRARTVDVNWDALSPAASEVRLNLFDDAVLTAELLRVDRSVIDGYVWVGRIMGMPDSLVTLSVSGDVLDGTVRLAGRERYTIGPATGSAAPRDHVIREIDPNRGREPGGDDAVLPPPLLGSALPDTTQATTCEDGSVVDLLVAYTPAAAALRGGTSAMESWINARISEMNSANADSQASFVWRLTGIQAVDYDESGHLPTDLDRLQKADDVFLDAVHSARIAAKADLVNLIVSMGNGGSCGLAYQMVQPVPGFAAYAFGITALDYEDSYTCSSLTLSHEFGHGMGNAHNRENAGPDVVIPYAYGYQDPGQTFRTIMAYDCRDGCPRVNRWSNPDTSYNGLPAGMSYDSILGYGADVAQSMTELSELVANFQPNCPAVTPTDTPTPVPDVTVEPTETPLPTATATTQPTDPPPGPTATSTTEPPTAAPPTASPPTATPQPTNTPAPTAPPPTAPVPTATRSLVPNMPYRLMLPVVMDR